MKIIEDKKILKRRLTNGNKKIVYRYYLKEPIIKNLFIKHYNNRLLIV